MKLLIVDDEPVIVRGLLQLIDYAALGYDQVLSATKSSDALHLLRTQKPEALLSDIAMPGLSGLELLRLIRDESIVDYEDLPDLIESGEEAIAQLEEAVDLLISVVKELKSIQNTEA